MAITDSQNANTLSELGQLISSSIQALNELQGFPDSALNGLGAMANGTLNGTANGTANGSSNGVDGAAKKETTPNAPESKTLPPRDTFNVQRNLLAAAGKLTELVSSPSNRLLEVSSQYFEARALHIAVDKRIPNLIDTAPEKVLTIEALAKQVGIEPRKLCKLLHFGHHFH